MPQPTPAHLGTAIREVRNERGLSIEALAQRAGISWRYLSMIERGERGSPGWIVVTSLAEGLGVRVSELARKAEENATSLE